MLDETVPMSEFLTVFALALVLFTCCVAQVLINYRSLKLLKEMRVAFERLMEIYDRRQAAHEQVIKVQHDIIQSAVRDGKFAGVIMVDEKPTIQ